MQEAFFNKMPKRLLASEVEPPNPKRSRTPLGPVPSEVAAEDVAGPGDVMSREGLHLELDVRAEEEGEDSVGDSRSRSREPSRMASPILV